MVVDLAIQLPIHNCSVATMPVCCMAGNESGKKIDDVQRKKILLCIVRNIEAIFNLDADKNYEKIILTKSEGIIAKIYFIYLKKQQIIEIFSTIVALKLIYKYALFTNVFINFYFSF